MLTKITDMLQIAEARVSDWFQNYDYWQSVYNIMK